VAVPIVIARLARPGWFVAVLTLTLGVAAGCEPAQRVGEERSPAPQPGSASPSAGGAVGSPPTEQFESTIAAIPPAMAAEMTGVSWRPGCPVALSDLRLVRLTYWGFDNAPHQGELIVHAQAAPAIVRVFGKLYAARFPIHKMRRVDAYGGNDLDSMADDNTSMFNCRNAYGSTRWSVHAFGRAIDINTVENPYLPGRLVLPPAGAAYLDRRNVRPGMIVSGDVVTQAFAAEGFRWGGDWTSAKDYQHFEVNP